jgi:hypothetical protein
MSCDNIQLCHQYSAWIPICYRRIQIKKGLETSAQRMEYKDDLKHP